MTTVRFSSSAGTALVLALALSPLLPGCFAYCPLYATSGCLEQRQFDELAVRGQHERLVDYLEDERSWVREEAARAIGEHRVRSGATAVAARLSDPAERRYVRAAAARALADLGRTDAVPELARIAARPDAAPELELAAIESLCRLAPAANETKDTLRALADDEDLLVAEAAKHQRRGGCGR